MEDETVATSGTPAEKQAAPSEWPQPEPSPSIPETSAEAVPTNNSGAHEPLETPPVPAPVPVASSAPEDVPQPQDVVRPKVLPTRSERAVKDGEEAGPSGLNSHPPSSSSSAAAAPFLPFSGGGQRLGGLGGEAGPSSSSLPALTTTLASPKAKKAKSNHSSSTKVSLNNTSTSFL